MISNCLASRGRVAVVPIIYVGALAAKEHNNDTWPLLAVMRDYARHGEVETV